MFHLGYILFLLVPIIVCIVGMLQLATSLLSGVSLQSLLFVLHDNRYSISIFLLTLLVIYLLNNRRKERLAAQDRQSFRQDWSFNRQDQNFSQSDYESFRETQESPHQYQDYEQDYDEDCEEDYVKVEDEFDKIFFSSPEEYVLYLESLRLSRGYMPGWIFHRCRELGLLDVLKKLRAQGRVPPYQQGSATAHTHSNQKTHSHSNEKKTNQKHSQQAAKEIAYDDLNSNDDHKTLGVSKTASLVEIKQAYWRAMKQYHPDRFQDKDPKTQEYFKRKSTSINLAYERLAKACM